MKILLFLYTLLFTSAFSMEIIGDQDKSFAQVVMIKGDVLVSSESGEWRTLQAGERISNFVALKTKDSSYLKILLGDNSLVHLGHDTFLTLTKKKDFEFNIGRGQLRILSYKNKKLIKTPWGESLLERGEFIWDVFKVKNKLKVSLTALSGSVSLEGEVVTPKVYERKPEDSPESALVFDKSHILYFGQPKSEKSYDLAFEPSFPKREIASIEDVIIEGKVESAEEEDSFVSVKGDIWVHDIVYDEAVRAIESAAFEKASELVRPAIIEAADGLVWEVASRSVLKWGVQYAERLSDLQVPIAVQGSYLGRREDVESFYEKDAYQNSTQEITRLRAYRAAKVAVLKTGYKKGWVEAQRYAQSMLPKIVIPIVSKNIYEYVKPKGLEAVKKVIKKGNLVHTPDVDRLIDHLSQLASIKFTKKLMAKYGPVYTRLAAQNAAREAARSAAEDIANYMSDKSSKRAGKIMGDLIARERARNIASEVAQEAKKEDAESFKNRSRRLIIESQR